MSKYWSREIKYGLGIASTFTVIVIPLLYLESREEKSMREKLDSSSESVFTAYDINRDNRIDANEFKRLADDYEIKTFPDRGGR